MVQDSSVCLVVQARQRVTTLDPAGDMRMLAPWGRTLPHWQSPGSPGGATGTQVRAHKQGLLRKLVASHPRLLLCGGQKLP